jgi:hypothetical protein
MSEERRVQQHHGRRSPHIIERHNIKYQDMFFAIHSSVATQAFIIQASSVASWPPIHVAISPFHSQSPSANAAT